MNNSETFSVTEPLFHAAYYEDVEEYLDVCVDQNLAVCLYSPLAGGFLTGKYERVGDGTCDLDAPGGDACGAFRSVHGLLRLRTGVARSRRRL